MSRDNSVRTIGVGFAIVMMASLSAQFRSALVEKWRATADETLGRGKVADDQREGLAAEMGLGPRGMLVSSEQRDGDAGVDIVPHRSHSSRSALTRVAPSLGGTGDVARRAASQSRSASVIGRSAASAGSISGTGRPRRVIRTASPCRARPISCESWFFAPATL